MNFAWGADYSCRRIPDASSAKLARLADSARLYASVWILRTRWVVAARAVREAKRGAFDSISLPGCPRAGKDRVRPRSTQPPAWRRKCEHCAFRLCVRGSTRPLFTRSRHLRMRVEARRLRCDATGAALLRT